MQNYMRKMIVENIKDNTGKETRFVSNEERVLNNLILEYLINKDYGFTESVFR